MVNSLKQQWSERLIKHLDKDKNFSGQLFSLHTNDVSFLINCYPEYFLEKDNSYSWHLLRYIEALALWKKLTSCQVEKILLKDSL